MKTLPKDVGYEVVVCPVKFIPYCDWCGWVGRHARSSGDARRACHAHVRSQAHQEVAATQDHGKAA